MLAAQGQSDRDAYEGARRDLLDWKHRALSAESILRSLGYRGIVPTEPPTSPAGVPDVSKLQRYFPSLPTHPGWQMSPTPLGEWVLFADVQAMIAPEGDDQMQDVNAKQLTPDEALATHKKWERHFRQSE